LDRLREVLKRTTSAPLAEDDYDGEVRTKAMHDIAMPEVIVRIMWRLFDYEALSNRSHPDVDAMCDPANPGVARIEEPLHEDTNLDNGAFAWDNLAGFDDQFQANEWQLFGMPWAAYDPDDPSLPSQLH
jgi:hypothetical protein